jgi:hypothetical protein
MGESISDLLVVQWCIAFASERAVFNVQTSITKRLASKPSPVRFVV